MVVAGEVGSPESMEDVVVVVVVGVVVVVVVVVVGGAKKVSVSTLSCGLLYVEDLYLKKPCFSKASDENRSTFPYLNVVSLSPVNSIAFPWESIE